MFTPCVQHPTTYLARLVVTSSVPDTPPARRRVRGIAAQSVFTTLLLMAANIRKIRAWRALTTAAKASITRRARRRRASLRDYPPDG